MPWFRKINARQLVVLGLYINREWLKLQSASHPFCTTSNCTNGISFFFLKQPVEMCPTKLQEELPNNTLHTQRQFLEWCWIKFDDEETMFIHCLDIYLEFHSAISKERVLILQILPSVRCLPLHSMSFIEIQKSELVTENMHTSVLNRFFPSVCTVFYCFTSCLVIVTLKAGTFLVSKTLLSKLIPVSRRK